MKPLEKFLKKQTSQLAGRTVSGGPGGGLGSCSGPGGGGGPGGGSSLVGGPRPLQRRQSVSRLLLPAFLREPPAEPGLDPPTEEEAAELAGVTEEPGSGGPCWLQLEEVSGPGSLGGGGPLRSPSSYSSDELSPGEPLTPPPWAPLGAPERPEHLLHRVLERLAGGATRDSGASGKEWAGEQRACPGFLCLALGEPGWCCAGAWARVDLADIPMAEAGEVAVVPPTYLPVEGEAAEPLSPAPWTSQPQAPVAL